MIKKLQKRLMLLFLSFTMLIFTAAMCLMIRGTVKRAQSYEIEYVENMADSIIELACQSKDLSELNLSKYNEKLQGYIFVSDGIHQQSSSENTALSLEMVSRQIKSGKNILSMEQIEADGTENGAASRTICTIYDSNKKEFYGLHSTFFINGTPTEIILTYPRSTFGSIFQKNCIRYLAVWAGVCLLMFFISRFLIGEAIRPVETAMKSQKDFIASASHELKSPLAVIQANAETLRVEDMDAVSAQKQKVILNECSRMSGLVQALLSLAASDTGHWTMDMKKTDVDTLLIETWEEYIEPAQKKNLHLDLDIEEQYPLLVCDKNHIKQALGVLFDNAISYSPSGASIETGAKVMEKSILFYVKDHGPGIANEEKGKVFQRFYSGDQSRTDKNHYGLGLSIALEIVKLHRGTIIVKDTPGGGCTVEVQIPIE